MLNYESITICGWPQLVESHEKLAGNGGQWIFRGQSDSSRRLTTTLERAMTQFDRSLEETPAIERELLREFQRRCHHFVSQIPKKNDTLEWLALMRHYKAPTRLLDWTYSFWVALYFAVEHATGECSVWALDTAEMPPSFGSILHQYPLIWSRWDSDRAITKVHTFNEIFMSDAPITIVGAVNPHKLNERLVLQQGIFLCPGNTAVSFEENLNALLTHPEFKGKLTKLIISDDTKLRKEILARLNRMNVNQATLFPGLEGFAQSLGTHWRFLA